MARKCALRPICHATLGHTSSASRLARMMSDMPMVAARPQVMRIYAYLFK